MQDKEGGGMNGGLRKGKGIIIGREMEMKQQADNNGGLASVFGCVRGADVFAGYLCGRVRLV